MVRKQKASMRKKPTQKRSQLTVDALLEATAQVLVDCGYNKASTNRIAERAGVSIGSLYEYFPNKDSLVTALIEKNAAEVLAKLTLNITHYISLKPKEAIKAWILEVIDVLGDKADVVRVCINQVPYLMEIPSIQTLDSSLVQVATQVSANFLPDQQRLNGERRNTRIILLTTMVGAAIVSITINPPKSVDHAVDELTDMVARMLDI